MSIAFLWYRWQAAEGEVNNFPESAGFGLLLTPNNLHAKVVQAALGAGCPGPPLRHLSWLSYCSWNESYHSLLNMSGHQSVGDRLKHMKKQSLVSLFLLRVKQYSLRTSKWLCLALGANELGKFTNPHSLLMHSEEREGAGARLGAGH